MRRPSGRKLDRDVEGLRRSAALNNVRTMMISTLNIASVFFLLSR